MPSESQDEQLNFPQPSPKPSPRLKLNVDNCAMSPGKRANLKHTEQAKQMFRQFLETEILMCAKLNFHDSNLKPETPLTPDLGELDFKASLPGLKVLPLEDDLELVLMKESIKLDKNDNESTQFIDGSELLALRENHFASERTGILPKNKRSLSQTHSYNSSLQSPTSINDYNRQTQLVSQTSSFSSVSTVLKGPCDQESEHFLPSKRAKRKGIICCCVG